MLSVFCLFTREATNHRFPEFAELTFIAPLSFLSHWLAVIS